MSLGQFFVENIGHNWIVSGGAGSIWYRRYLVWSPGQTNGSLSSRETENEMPTPLGSEE